MQPYDVVVALYDIKFCDGTVHRQGSKHVVTPRNLAYFEINRRDYVLTHKV